jgi:hypothetical protein
VDAVAAGFFDRADLMGQVRAGLELYRRLWSMLNRCRTRLASPSQSLYTFLTRPHPRPETIRVHVEEIAAVSDEQRLVFWSSHTRTVRCWVNAVSERQKKAGTRT